MKLLLTSSGIVSRQIAIAFRNLVTKDLSQIKLLYIPTATDGSLNDINRAANELSFLSLDPANVSIYNLEYEMPLEELTKYEIIYVGGGNTFYLLERFRETGFLEKLKTAIYKGIPYIGLSAGSIIAGPTIQTAYPFDKNVVEMTDFTGMNLIDKIIIPHYHEDRMEIVNSYKKTFPFEIITLNNYQALLVTDDRLEIIGN